MSLKGTIRSFNDNGHFQPSKYQISYSKPINFNTRVVKLKYVYNLTLYNGANVKDSPYYGKGKKGFSEIVPALKMKRVENLPTKSLKYLAFPLSEPQLKYRWSIFAHSNNEN